MLKEAFFITQAHLTIGLLLSPYSGFPQVVYAVSYMYYSLIGTFLTVFIGWIVSWMTGSRDDAYDSNLLHPVIYKLSLLIPGRDRHYTNYIEREIKSNKSSNIVIEHDNLAFEMKSENECEKSKNLHNSSTDTTMISNGIMHSILEPEADNDNLNVLGLSNESYRKLDEEDHNVSR